MSVTNLDFRAPHLFSNTFFTRVPNRSFDVIQRLLAHARCYSSSSRLLFSVAQRAQRERQRRESGEGHTVGSA